MGNVVDEFPAFEAYVKINGGAPHNQLARTKERCCTGILGRRCEQRFWGESLILIKEAPFVSFFFVFFCDMASFTAL